MKYRMMVILPHHGGSWLKFGNEASKVIDNKYPDLGFAEMHPDKPIPPEVDQEYEDLKARMAALAREYVAEDYRMITKRTKAPPFEIMEIEFDLETGKAIVLKHRPVTTESGFVYNQFYDPENP